ncbi:CYTH and CHAD domain-containing protein [Sphingobium subterraneum]|uniref:Inorganic triphosphatase YgiF n=1 Tax=Sphingobium subterraneum TaxID=627688 RepID=A0A841J2H9_9SPHN|nr:CYTH and CHAD domain-containing protein [Sphingobium subterraneum]MBB6124880.1 inorganic triphosphatase YgiF [Sphingobium subterraneum]
MNQEIELKLDIAAEDASRLLAAKLFPGRRTSVHQDSLYFDTPDGLLQKGGLSLRIRTVKKRKVQTVKLAKAGVVLRGEWELPVLDDVPVLDGASPLKDFLGERGDDLRPLFRVENLRSLWTVRTADAAVEIALDRSTLRAGDRQAQRCEIELELQGGSPAVLFAWARDINTVVPARIGVLCKADVGYRLVQHIAGASKAEPLPLDATLSAGEAFRHIVHSCLRQYRLNEDILLTDSDRSAVHQARVALRRLRSALRLFRPMVKGRRHDRFAHDLQWLTRILGRARDIDVLLSEELPTDIQVLLHEARRKAYADVRAALESPRVRLLMIELTEWTETGRWRSKAKCRDLRDTPVATFARERLDALFHNLGHDGHHLDDMDEEERHTLRKKAKRLRYSTEFFASLYDAGKTRKQCVRFLAALEELQDRLGALTDRSMRQALFDELGLGTVAMPDDGKSAQAHAHMLASAQDALDQLVDCKKFWRDL